MPTQLRVLTLTWEDIIHHVAIVAAKIRDSGWKPDTIIAIARGGLVPAMLLSDFLDIKDILTIQLEHWPAPGKVEEEVRLKHGLPSVDLSQRNVLIVDDVADTGDTLKFALDYVRNNYRPRTIRTAALHVKKGKTRFIPDYWGVEIDPQLWIVYPWNYVEDLTSLMKKVIEDSVDPVTMLEKLQKDLGVELSKVSALCIKEAMRRVLGNANS